MFVDDLRATVDALRARGRVPGGRPADFKTDDAVAGIGPYRAAWFTDCAVNIWMLSQQIGWPRASGVSRPPWSPCQPPGP
ncbi:MAG TPA: hypothetical protein VHF25_01025 [Nitriliruptorales bacterium]|nr:hypothetical protein [Nitriliruptorales bacterium]